MDSVNIYVAKRFKLLVNIDHA